MAHLEDRWETPEGRRHKRWRVRWREPNGRHRARSFDRRADAQRFLNDTARRLDAGQYVDPSRGRATLAEVVEAWWSSHEPLLKPSTARTYRGIVAGLSGTELGDTPVVALDYTTLARHVAELHAQRSGSTVRQRMQVINQALDAAVRDGRIPSNPGRLVRLPRPTPARRHRYLDAHELERLAWATDWARPVVLTFGYCGLRWGELAALRPGDVDHARGRIHVDRAVTPTSDGPVYLSPKSHQRREVPAPDAVLEAIGELEPAGELLFTTPRGAPLRNQNFRRRTFLPALEAVGLPSMRLHELRHTAASLAVAAGADVLAVARMLGHADPSMTLRVYADLFDRDLDELRERLDRVARRARADLERVVVPLDTYR